MKKILLSKLRALGDTVLLSATLDETRRLYPQDEIHLLVPEAWKDLYKNDPRIKQLWTFDTRLKGWRRLREFFRLASQLRHLDVDISLACHANPTSSWLGFLSGAQERAHHNHNFLESNRLGNVEIPGKKVLKPFIQRDLAVLEALEKRPNLNADSKLFVSNLSLNWAKKEIERLGLKTPILALGLGASRVTKIWPIEYFSETSLGWTRETGGSVFSLISPDEKPLAESWKKMLPSREFVFGSHYDVDEMMGLLTQCQLFLGNDSGPRHLAAALGLPTITLYGPQDPFECHPYDAKKHPYFYIENLKCRINTDLEGKHPWCGISMCEIEAHRCMKDLKAAAVLKKCLEIELGSK